MMARIVVLRKEDVRKALASLARPQTHIVVTDEASQVMLVPKVTSRHRHYYQYSGPKEEVAELVEAARKEGYEVIVGFVMAGEG